MQLGLGRLRWTWDPAKNETNQGVHHLSFEMATLVFDDPLSATQEDPHPHEHRWRTLGVVGQVTLLVVHTWPETDPVADEAVGRIISAHKATSHERQAYEEGTY